MKTLFLCLLICTAFTTAAQQPLIHAHNDYAKPEPLFNALCNKAFSIEADVYPGDSLFVAHDKKRYTTGKNIVKHVPETSDTIICCA